MNSQRAYSLKYLQFPEVLLYGRAYEHMSDGAKIAYMVLLNRLSYSLQNNWVDKNNHVYFIFTNMELNKLLHWSNNKINRVKKELEQAGLLLQKKMGFDPRKKKNLPNHLYLADLEVTAKDVYVKQEFLENMPETLEPSGLTEMRRRQENPENLEPSGLTEMRQYLYNTNLDTSKIHEDTQLDFSSNKYSPHQVEQQNMDLVNHVTETMSVKAIPDFLNQASLKLIKLWCNTPAEINRFIRIILNAKNAAQQEAMDNGFGNNSYLDLQNEVLQTEVTKWLRSYFDRIRAADRDPKKRVNNAENYLYTTMRNNFNKHMHEQLQSTKKE
ncbi:replication initiator protein A [Lactobacillus kimbladii]|uniref:replication initiator protein A n=1 Tax=Lactobacillus kimbladii TaxID=1218506 RepID=UPI000A038F90